MPTPVDPTKTPQAHDDDDDAVWERSALARARAAGMETPLSKRGEDAVWSRDAAGLAAALADGWTLPAFRHGTGHGHDLGLVFGTVTSGWLEGWRLLRQRWPELAANDQLLLAAISAARPSIIDDMLTVHPRQRIERKRENTSPPPSSGLANLKRLDMFRSPSLPPPPEPAALSLFHELITTLLRDMGEPVDPQVLVECARVLEKHGMDPATPYPGRFQEDDEGLAGHTLWTMAVREGKWVLARALAPASFEQVQRHPRWRMALEEWFECAWLGRKMLLYVLPPSQLAQAGWLEVVAPMASQWLEVSDHLLRPTGWPALLAMTPTQRLPVWEYLLSMTGMNGLNWITLGAEEDPSGARTLLRLIYAEYPDRDRLLSAWSSDPQGDGPCHVWARQTRTPLSLSWPELA